MGGGSVEDDQLIYIRALDISDGILAILKPTSLFFKSAMRDNLAHRSPLDDMVAVKRTSEWTWQNKTAYTRLAFNINSPPGGAIRASIRNQQ